MAVNIDKVLSKGTLKGREIGKILFASLIHDIHNQHSENYKPLFTQKDFDRMYKSIKTPADFIEYDVYRKLYGATLDAYNLGSAFHQQFFNGYGKLTNILFICERFDEGLTKAEDYPLIMTMKQYNRYKALAAEQLEQSTDTFASLLLHCVEYFIEHPEEAPEDIAEAIEATEEETATNSRILSAYNKDMGKGYYILPTGERSDQLSNEQWQAAVEDEFLSRMPTHYTEAREATREEALEHYNMEAVGKIYQLIFEAGEGIAKRYKEVMQQDLPEELAQCEDALIHDLDTMRIFGASDYVLKARAPVSPYYTLLLHLIEDVQGGTAEWHYYTELPELTKYDILSECFERYTGVLEADLSEQEQFEEFKADYPKLYKLLEKYIKTSVPAFKKIKAADYFTTEVTCKELAAVDFLDYQAFIKPDKYNIIQTYCDAAEQSADSLINFNHQRRLVYNGIAIITEPRQDQIDDNGDYISTDNPLSSFYNIERVCNEPELLFMVNQAREVLLKPALRRLYAYNTLLDIISVVYGIKNLDQAKHHTGPFEEQVTAYNKLVAIYCAKVYGNEQEKNRQRRLIRKVFKQIDIESLKPTEEAIQQITLQMTQLGLTSEARENYTTFDSILSILANEGV